MGTGFPFPGDKAPPGRDADHLPHIIPKSGMSWSYTPLPFFACMALEGQFYYSLNDRASIPKRQNLLFAFKLRQSLRLNQFIIQREPKYPTGKTGGAHR
jgi:hypothetical protein